MAIYGYTKNYKLIKPQYDTDTWHDYEYDNLDTIDAVLSAIYASGNWKGFWATNTAYVVGDVVIDRDTDTMYKVMVEHTTSEATFAAEQTAHPDYYELWSPNNLAESWAIKTDGKVSNEDYSAKAYAISSGLIDDGSAKEWAIGSGAIGNTNEYSAKKYATDAHNDYISMTTNPNVVAVASNINNVNAVGPSISSVNTVAGDISSVNTVAGVSTDVTAVASIASSVPTVANNDANITTVANNISDINTVASNMAAIQAAPTAATNAANSATDSANSATASATSAQAAQNALNEVQGLIATPIGTIFQSVYVDESLDIARRLNGQLISSTKFTGFRSWLNTVQTANPNLFTTETNWQAEKTNSKLGQCGKFVVDDTAGTIRLPAVVNAQGLADLALIGGIKSESLPTAVALVGYNGASGEFRQKVANYTYTSDSHQRDTSAPMSAETTSGSQVDYLNDKPVQQEAVQYPYYIQVATGVEETLPAIREYNINTPFFFGQSMYSDVAPDNASWLVSNGQYNARSVYPDYYDWLVEQRNTNIKTFYKWHLTTDPFMIPFSTLTNTLSVGMTIYAYMPTVVLGEITAISGNEVTIRNDVINQTYPLSIDVANPTTSSLYLYDRSKINFISKTELDGWDFPINTSDYDFVINTADQTFRLPLLNGKENIPDYSMASALSNTGTITINKNGWVNYTAIRTNQVALVTISGVSYRSGSSATNDHGSMMMPVNKGDTVTGAGNADTSYFIPAKGHGTLYYYVGDTVQDASLINAGAVLGQLATKTNSVEAAAASMPSGRYIDLTLGASGSTYTAPANGWFVLHKAANKVGQYVYMNTTGVDIGTCFNVASGTDIPSYFLPVKSGDIVRIDYTLGGATKQFRFIYAEGENNV